MATPSLPLRPTAESQDAEPPDPRLLERADLANGSAKPRMRLDQATVRSPYQQACPTSADWSGQPQSCYGSQSLWVLATGGRAINVQLAKVTSGQSRLLAVPQVSCSAASSAAICPIPKLTVRVRFSSPDPGFESAAQMAYSSRPTALPETPDCGLRARSACHPRYATVTKGVDPKGDPRA